MKCQARQNSPDGPQRWELCADASCYWSPSPSHNPARPSRCWIVCLQQTNISSNSPQPFSWTSRYYYRLCFLDAQGGLMLVHLVVVVPACRGFLAPSQKCYYNCKKVCWRVPYKVSRWNFRVPCRSFQLENPLEFDVRFRKSSNLMLTSLEMCSNLLYWN